MKIIKILLISFLIIAIGYAVILYFTLKPKTRDVSQLSPYFEIIGKDLIVQREAKLVRNLPAFVYENPYLIQENDQPVYEGITEIYTIPVGTVIKIDKAQFIKNGVSGFTHSVVFGTLEIPGQGLKSFEYVWGNQANTLDANKPLEFSFPMASWQTTSDDATYEFK